MFLDKEAIFSETIEDGNQEYLQEGLIEEPPPPEPIEFEAHYTTSGGIKVSSIEIETEKEVSPLPSFSIIRNSPKSSDSDITEAASILRAYISANDLSEVPSARSIVFLRRTISGADSSQLSFLQSLVSPVDFESTATSSTLEHKLRAKGIVTVRSSSQSMESSFLLCEKPLSNGSLFVEDIDEDMSAQSAHSEVRTDKEMSTDQTTCGVVASEMMSI
jgi:hypothetical protein